MKPETQHVASEVIQKIAENPKGGMGVSGLLGWAGWNLDANDFALWLGIALAAVSLYNQVMVAVRSRQKDKITK